MNKVIVGIIVNISAWLPSNAASINKNAERSASSPVVICGSRRRAGENPGSRNPSPWSVSKHEAGASWKTSNAGPSPAWIAYAAQTRSRQRRWIGASLGDYPVG